MRRIHVVLPTAVAFLLGAALTVRAQGEQPPLVGLPEYGVELEGTAEVPIIVNHSGKTIIGSVVQFKDKDGRGPHGNVIYIDNEDDWIADGKSATTTVAAMQVSNSAANEVHIFANLAELISDLESELAFVVGHELGHIIQNRIQKLALVPTNIEEDADEYGVFLSLLSGYDPYGGAGALAKLAMASGTAGLVSQVFDNLSTDPHGSFNNRLSLMFTYMQAVCSIPQAQSGCAQYKSIVHPHQ